MKMKLLTKESKMSDPAVKGFWLTFLCMFGLGALLIALLVTVMGISHGC